MIKRLRKHRAEGMWLLAILLTFVLATLNFPATFIGSQRMDWLLLLPWVAGYFYGEKSGMTVGLACGFLRDLLFARFFGSGMLISMLTGILAAKFFARQFDRKLSFFPLQYLLMFGIYIAMTLALGLLRNSLVGFVYVDFVKSVLRYLHVSVFINVFAAMALAVLVRYVLKPLPFVAVIEAEYAEEPTAI